MDILFKEHFNRFIDGISVDEYFENLDDLEKEILALIGSRQQMTRAELSKIIGRSAGTITSRLNQLIDKGLVKRQGSKHDPTQTYVLA